MRAQDRIADRAGRKFNVSAARLAQSLEELFFTKLNVQPLRLPPRHRRSLLQRLNAIRQPVFVANGDDDRMILPWYSHLVASLLPDAFVKLYPDSAHGFLFQHAEEFAGDVLKFLGA
jgi:pimeloyl-ACP methyl ester carboxylesterase